jgi:hypothetical protein
MSKLIDKLKEKGDDLLDEKGDQWMGRVLDMGRTTLRGRAVDGSLDAEAVKAASRAMDILDENKKPFVRLGKVGFAWTMAHFVDGDEAAAKRKYLETKATFRERRAAMHAAGNAAFDERQEREEAWKETEEARKWRERPLDLFGAIAGVGINPGQIIHAVLNSDREKAGDFLAGLGEKMVKWDREQEAEKDG